MVFATYLNATENPTLFAFRCKLDKPMDDQIGFLFVVKNIQSPKKAELVAFPDKDDLGEYIGVKVIGTNGKIQPGSEMGGLHCFNGQGIPGVNVGKYKGSPALSIHGDCDGMIYLRFILFLNSTTKAAGYIRDTGSETKGYWKVQCIITNKKSN